MKKTLMISIFLIGTIAFIPIYAFAVPCGEGFLAPSSSCSDGPTSGGNDSADYLNDNNYFGINTWMELSKIEVDDTVPPGFDLVELVDIDLVVSGSLQEGSWSFNPNIWLDYSSIAIVLKGGNLHLSTPLTGIKWSAYLVTQYSSSGGWDFREDDKALSHFTVYGSKNPVPEPATMLLFGTGLIGLAGLRLRKKNK